MTCCDTALPDFSALQRAEIAEIPSFEDLECVFLYFSALQRAEIAEIFEAERFDVVALSISVLFNEPKLLKCGSCDGRYSSAFISVLFNEPKLLKSRLIPATQILTSQISVLFNEPKLLKFVLHYSYLTNGVNFSALQRAEIAEIYFKRNPGVPGPEFQCSSTSRNC